MDNSQCLLYAMGHTGESAGVPHSVYELLLIRARVFARELDFDIQSLAVPDTMTHDIGFAVVADVYDGAVLGVELAHRMVSSYATVLTQGCDDLVLEYRFFIDVYRLPCGWRSGSL